MKRETNPERQTRLRWQYLLKTWGYPVGTALVVLVLWEGLVRLLQQQFSFWRGDQVQRTCLTSKGPFYRKSSQSDWRKVRCTSA